MSTVSGQNITGIYIIPLVLMQLTDNQQIVVCNNQLLKLQLAVRNKILYWLLELQPAVMLQFCNIIAGCNFNHQLLYTIFGLLPVSWIKVNSMTYIPIMFFPLTD